MLRSFGHVNNGLNRPYGICVSCQYVYVCNNGGHNVSVFTTAGHYVSSFGQVGHEDPRGICIDQHAIVCACDYINGRVQFF